MITFPIVLLSIRYLQNVEFIGTEEHPPILIYTGNEGDIELFAQNTGLMWELAPKLKAEIIFAEHRYYGKSLPFNESSYASPDKLGYLSSEQALADFADLLMFLNPKYERSVIAFGGSYGGMLAAWLRIKYPHLVDGVLASSAPVRQFEVECDIYNRILTSVFKTAYPNNANCSNNIAKFWSVIKTQINDPTGKANINKKFHFCTPLNTTEDVNLFFDYLNDVLSNIAMQNYPYPSGFLAPLPAYPVREFCSRLNETLNDTKVIDAFASALSIYVDFNKKCLNITSAFDPKFGDLGWDFQSCTEMVMPMCQNGGATDMFPPKPWDFKAFSDDCFKKFKVRPRSPQAAVTEYGGGRLDSASNIIFTNGLLDPWSGGGIFNPPSSSREIYTFILPEGAHHLDLRAADKEDPGSVTELRKQFVQIFKKWIKSAHYRKVPGHKKKRFF